MKLIRSTYKLFPVLAGKSNSNYVAFGIVFTREISRIHRYDFHEFSDPVNSLIYVGLDFYGSIAMRFKFYSRVEQFSPLFYMKTSCARVQLDHLILVALQMNQSNWCNSGAWEKGTSCQSWMFALYAFIYNCVTRIEWAECTSHYKILCVKGNKAT